MSLWRTCFPIQMTWKTLIFLLMMNVSLGWQLLVISANAIIGQGVVEKKKIKAVFELSQSFGPFFHYKKTKASNALENQPMVWLVPCACTKRYSLGSSSHVTACRNNEGLCLKIFATNDATGKRSVYSFDWSLFPRHSSALSNSHINHSKCFPFSDWLKPVAVHQIWKESSPY